MGKWRSKLLLSLIIYFAGFATAIYALAPASGKARLFGVAESRSEDHVAAESRSAKLALNFNGAMHKFLGFAEGKAVDLGEMVKAKLAERQESGEK